MHRPVSMLCAIGCLATGLVATAAMLEARANAVSGTAVVYLDQTTGPAENLASGFIYGIPDTPGQIPDHFYTDIHFKYARAGGAQLPNHGWIESLEAYRARFQSTLSNYRTTRKYGANFILLFHDLWGADTTQPADAPYPGDNGDWSNYEKFLSQLIGDMKANDMIEGVVLDIWNEPDLTAFWNRGQAQWIEMWGHGYHILREQLPGTLTTGPSLARWPNNTNTWWTDWATFIQKNGSIPDQYAWHMESGGGDMESAMARYKGILESAGLATDHVVNINEYAVLSEQTPAGGAWWISQLERVNALGLRGNWGSTGALHDFMAGLIGKPGAGTSAYNASAGGYWPAAEFQVYKYYAQSMVGQRVRTKATGDLRGEVYATIDDKAIRLLVGTRLAQGAFTVRVESLRTLGFAEAGSVKIHALAFNGSVNHFLQMDAPSDLGSKRVSYVDGVLDIPITQTDNFTAWAFEISRASCMLAPRE